jgi:hypothetical protein
MFFEQGAQGFAIEHIDLYTFDTVDFTFAPAAGDNLCPAIAQHLGS